MDTLIERGTDRPVPLTSREAEILGALRVYAHIYDGATNFAIVGEALGVSRSRIHQLAQVLQKKHLLTLHERGVVVFNGSVGQ